jgi:NRPS condensation-like uncharacterized protein
MRYKAEVFDKLQYLYEVTKYNDHQLHCVINLADKLDAGTMRKAVSLLLQTVPMLSCVYRHNDGDAYWEDVRVLMTGEAFTVVNNQADFDRFTTSKTNEATGPQIKVCLFSSDKDALSIIMNHMVCDAAGFKQCLYLLADLYSNLMQNPDYLPGYIIDGNRDFEKVISEVSLRNKIKALLCYREDSNQSGRHTFPLSQDEITGPFILTHELPEKRYTVIQDYCEKNKVTVNDVMLAAYYRVLAKMLNIAGKPLDIPIMVDMRRYLKPDNGVELSNLSSMINTSLAIDPAESFEITLNKVNKAMNLKKAAQIGLNAFIKLALLRKLFKIIGARRSYLLSKNGLKTPNICMTNIGILDAGRLVFKGSSITKAFMCGSIKYRPHFQMALSSYAGKITLSSNLYGSASDRDLIIKFFGLLDEELPR